MALAAGYADEFFSRLTGREPRIPVEGVKMSRHRMFVESGKAERELGLQPGAVEPALDAPFAGTASTATSAAAREQNRSRTRKLRDFLILYRGTYI